jgi:hypothetical protein
MHNASSRRDDGREAVWEAEVTRMIEVYGAPIEAADADKIVNYPAPTC